MSPMLSKLSLTKADISSQLTCILKTFRYVGDGDVLASGGVGNDGDGNGGNKECNGDGDGDGDDGWW